MTSSVSRATRKAYEKDRARIERKLRARYPELYARADRIIALAGVRPEAWITLPTVYDGISGILMDFGVGGGMLLESYEHDADDADIAAAIKVQAAKAARLDRMVNGITVQ